VHAVVDGVAVVQAVGEEGEGFDLALGGADCFQLAPAFRMNKGHGFGLQWFETRTPTVGVPPILSVQAGHCHAATVKEAPDEDPVRPPLLISLALSAPGLAQAEEIGCTTTWKLIGANHKVCVEAFHDAKVPGVTCHVSQARTGGVSGSLGLAQDPSQFSLACRQTGPITLPAKLPESETVFSEDTSWCSRKPASCACGTRPTTRWSTSPSAAS
jgi:hypothetical protein